MRTLTAPETSGLQSAHARSHLRLEIEGADGLFSDLTEALHSYSFSTDVNQTVIGGTFRLIRSSMLEPSLSPLVTDALDAGRRLRFYVTTLLHSAGTPVSGDLRLVLDAEIDSVDAGSVLVELVVRDWIGARIADSDIRTAVSFEAGTSLEDIVSGLVFTTQIFAGTLIPMDVEATGATIAAEVSIKPGKLLEALREAQSRNGWQLRPRWNEADQEFQLAFYEPPIDKVTVDWTIPRNRYIVIPTFKIDRTNIRNVITVQFYNEDKQAEDSVEVQDTASIARFGPRWMQLVEKKDESPIRTTAAATALANHAKSDLAFPLVEAEVDVMMLWPVDIDDRITLEANDEQFTTDQTLAVVGYTQEFGPNMERTRLQLRGKPTGNVRRWSRRPLSNATPVLRVTSMTRDLMGETYFFERTAFVGSIWVYLRTVPQSVDPESVPAPVVFTAADLVATLVTETEYTVPLPAAGYQTHVLFEPRGLDPAIVGVGRQFVVTALPVIPSLINPTHSEPADSPVGIYGVEVDDPSGLAAAVYQRTKAGPEDFTEWALVDTQPLHGETYTQSVQLVEGHPSTVEFRVDTVWGGAVVPVYSISAPFDFGSQANISGASHEIIGNRLWVTAFGDADTRTEGIIIIGILAANKSVEPTLGTYEFALANPIGGTTRGGSIDTGEDLPNPGPGLTDRWFVGLRAINVNEQEGPTHWIEFERLGITAPTATITTLVHTVNQAGVSCGDPAKSSIQYAVTAGGTDTVTLERYIDNALDGTPLSASATHSQTYIDPLPFHAGAGVANHDVNYRLIVKTSGGAVITSAWTSTITYTDVVGCP